MRSGIRDFVQMSQPGLTLGIECVNATPSSYYAAVMAIVGHVEETTSPDSNSSVFGDIDVNLARAIDDEVARRFRLGMPVIVGGDHDGVVDLNAG